MSFCIMFEINEIKHSEVLALLLKMTNNFKHISAESTGYMIKGMYNKNIIFMGTFPTPIPFIKNLLFERYNLCLKNISMKSKTNFIWEDLEKNTIVFFGSKSNVVRAMHMLQSRINKLENENPIVEKES